MNSKGWVKQLQHVRAAIQQYTSRASSQRGVSIRDCNYEKAGIIVVQCSKHESKFPRITCVPCRLSYHYWIGTSTHSSVLGSTSWKETPGGETPKRYYEDAVLSGRTNEVSEQRTQARWSRPCTDTLPWNKQWWKEYIHYNSTVCMSPGGHYRTGFAPSENHLNIVHLPLATFG